MVGADSMVHEKIRVLERLNFFSPEIISGRAKGKPNYLPVIDRLNRDDCVRIIKLDFTPECQFTINQFHNLTLYISISLASVIEHPRFVSLHFNSVRREIPMPRFRSRSKELFLERGKYCINIY
jgi:hypothetical protein